jgi:hypothetical protein
MQTLYGDSGGPQVECNWICILMWGRNEWMAGRRVEGRAAMEMWVRRAITWGLDQQCRRNFFVSVFAAWRGRPRTLGRRDSPEVGTEGVA